MRKPSRTTKGILCAKPRKQLNKVAKGARLEAEARDLGISVIQLQQRKSTEVQEVIVKQRQKELELQRTNRGNQYNLRRWGFSW